MVRSRAILATLVALSVGAVILPAVPAAAAPPPSSTITWTPCRDGFQCATVEAPLDYGNPGGDKVSLAVVRLPAGQPDRKIGSLFINPGGPGGSGVDIARGIAAF